jgi:hypothetical protein
MVLCSLEYVKMMDERINDVFDNLSKSSNKEYYTSFCKRGFVQIVTIDFCTARLQNDKRNNKDHNIVFDCDIGLYRNNQDYEYDNIKGVLLIAPVKTFMRMIKKYDRDKRVYVNRKLRIMFKLVNKKNYKLISLKDVTNIEV